MRYAVALTGGIGSGKSTVINALVDLGINVADADTIARQVVEPGTSALKAIGEHFGSDVIAADGSLQRRILCERIFSNPEERSWLNAPLHPLIQQEVQRQFQQATPPYLLWVVPLLVENSLYKKADRVLVVDITPETQLRHTTRHDDVMRKHVEQISAAQAMHEMRLAVVGDVVDNNGAPGATASDVARLHALYLRCAPQFVSQEKPQCTPRSLLNTLSMRKRAHGCASSP